jgi:hypothetical protein
MSRQNDRELLAQMLAGRRAASPQYRRLPVTVDDRPMAEEMNELREAILERQADADLSQFQEGATAVDPPDEVGDELVDNVTELRECIGRLVDRAWWGCLSGGDALRLVASDPPGADELNVFDEAGLGGDAWRKDPDVDPVHVDFPNDMRLVLNLLDRPGTPLVTATAATATTDVEADEDFATARAAAFASPYDDMGVYAADMLVGRSGHRFLTEGPPDEWTVDSQIRGSCVLEFDTAVGWSSLREAHLLIVEGPDVSGPALAVDVKIGTTTVGSIEIGTADARHLIQVDPSLVDVAGTADPLEISLEATTDLAADPTAWASGEDWHQGWRSAEDLPACRLLLRRGDYEYRPTAFAEGAFARGAFA